jgi:hypothetical protein
MAWRRVTNVLALHATLRSTLLPRLSSAYHPDLWHEENWPQGTTGSMARQYKPFPLIDTTPLASPPLSFRPKYSQVKIAAHLHLFSTIAAPCSSNSFLLIHI